jgi:hypothetical protein
VTVSNQVVDYDSISAAYEFDFSNLKSDLVEPDD